MGTMVDIGQSTNGEQRIPWPRIAFVLAVPLILIGLLFKFFSTTQAAMGRPQPAASSPAVSAPALSPSQQLTPTVDLEVFKSRLGNFTVGQTVTYTILVTNTGSITATGAISVTDLLPSGAVTPVVMGGNGWSTCNYSVSPALCIHANPDGLGPSQGLPPLRFVVTLGPGAAPAITNTVTVEHPEDSNLDNNTYFDSASVAAAGQGADLAVSKLVFPASSVEGSTITYTVVLTNNGPLAANQIVLTDTLPAGLTFITSTATTGAYTSTRGTWGVGSLAPGGSASLRLVARVNIGASGTITNTTDGVTSDQPDGNSGNNRGTAVFTLPTTRLVGVVSVQSSGVAISAATLRMVDAANHVYTATTDATGHYTFTSTTSAPIQPGNATVTASRRGYRFQTTTVALVAGRDNRQDFSLAPAADLVAFKTDGRTTVAPGDTITYTVYITNFGSLTASSLVITDIIPANFTYITDTLNLTHTTSGRNLIWRLPSSRDLAPNGALNFRVRGTVASTVASNTTISNTIQASNSILEGNPGDNSYSDIDMVSVSGTPNLAVTKSVSPSSAVVNGTLTFTIRVVNNGSAAATNVVVTDQFATYLNVTGQSTTQGTAILNSTTRTVTVSVGTLAAGGSATITVSTQVNSTATTTLTLSNTAVASYTSTGGTQTRSGSVTYQVIGTSTLPGTGWGPPAPTRAEPQRRAPVLSLLFGGLALAAAAAAVYLRRLRRERALFAGLSVWMLILAAVFSPSVTGWLRPPAAERLPETATGPAQVAQAQTEAPLEIVLPTPEVIETLPDYPIPVPEVTPTPGQKPPDTSAIQRILIPALGVDAVVKYVPYDGYTWMIAGLQHEVAWMGDTSWPGLGSNTGLAGHVTLRDGSNGPFRYLEDLASGDEITLFTEKNIYKYRVKEQSIVGQTDTVVVSPTAAKQLTLVTCTGWDANTRFYMERLVVTANLIDVEPRRIETRGN